MILSSSFGHYGDPTLSFVWFTIFKDVTRSVISRQCHFAKYKRVFLYQFGWYNILIMRVKYDGGAGKKMFFFVRLCAVLARQL